MKQYQLIQKRKNQGMSIHAIAVKLGQDRKTVRKYYRMDKEVFLRYLESSAERGKIFADYREEIIQIHAAHKDQSVYTSGIYDYLIEKYGTLPGSERTLRNYLMYLKSSGALVSEKGREYKPVAPLPYGKQAQIDFGQETTNLGKVHFVVVILARSRYRYVAAQNHPFSTLDVIDHLLDAFEFYGGVPEVLVLDQDRTLLIAENLGDLSTTKAFSDFVAEQGLTLHACRAADPESKGKVENSVKYVKTSFFSSRTFKDFDELTSALRFWLVRANARISQATKCMANVDFEAHEKPALRPLRTSLFRTTESGTVRKKRKVDQRSLISVGGTLYSVPSTYRRGEVGIEIRSDELVIFDPKTGVQIAGHTIVSGAASPIIVDSHYKDRTAPLKILQDNLLGLYPELRLWRRFIEGNWNEYHRYYREHAKRLQKLHSPGIEPEKLEAALSRCIELGLYSAQDLVNAYGAAGGVMETTQPAVPLPTGGILRIPLPAVQTRSLTAYTDVVDQAASKHRGTT